MYIDSKLYLKMLVSGANLIENSKDRINALNVFPVPDGDTGSNMSMTMSAVRKESEILCPTIAETAKKAAAMMLRSARGNSGVILSLFFKGVAKSFEGKDVIDPSDLHDAFMIGTGEAYNAIQNPTEGTILTVMRACAETEESAMTDAGDVFAEITKAAEDMLAKTPDMLPVLKQANVVDAGGAGFVEILKGMTLALKGEPVELSESGTGAAADFTAFSEEDIEFPYCTECIIKKSARYAGEGMAADFREFVMNAGNSAVFVDDEEIIKVHVHTKDPGAVMSEAIRYGSLMTVKVENMRIQHSELTGISADDAGRPETKKYGFVTVTMGDGIKEVFESLGADGFVYGGQTMNPSTDQIISAVRKNPGETVFVLPNNSNICLVARQAAELCRDKKVVVIPSTSVPQGVSAMLAFDGELGERENAENMTDALKCVKTYEMTFAAHDSTFDDKLIREGQILGLAEHKVVYVADDKAEIIDRFAGQMKDASYITLYYGEDASEEEAEMMSERIAAIVGDDAEITVINGGQPLYYYIVSAE